MSAIRTGTVIAGVVVMAVAVRGILVDAPATNPPGLALWVAGLTVAHDLLLAPVVAGAAALAWRRAPRWWGGPLTLAVALSGLLVGFSLPLVRGFGRRADTPSALPGDYAVSLAVLLALTWTVTASVVAVRGGRRR